MDLKRFFLAWILVVAFSQAALANGLTPPVFGGHFATPAEVDPAATYWNPGALGFVKGTQGFLNISPTYFYSTFISESTTTKVSSTLAQVTPLFAVTSDFGLENLTCALSIYAPYGGTTDWPPDGPQRYNGVKSMIMAVNGGPLVSYKVLPNLSVGAGAFYVYNSLNAK
jgi:long-chain fatty acid transport protein